MVTPEQLCFADEVGQDGRWSRRRSGWGESVISSSARKKDYCRPPTEIFEPSLLASPQIKNAPLRFPLTLEFSIWLKGRTMADVTAGFVAFLILMCFMMSLVVIAVIGRILGECYNE